MDVPVTRLRANREFRERANAAQVGIGTMIVFIATVLVAAIAAGVLIATSGKLSERSSRTGNEATEQVSSNLAVTSVVGLRNATSDAGLKELNVYVMLAPGAPPIDLAALRVQLQNGTELKTLEHADDATPGDGFFNATEVRDADDSFTSAEPVMTSGDLVQIIIDLASTENDLEYEPREHVLAILVPEVGSKVVKGFQTPATYGTETVIDLG